MSVAQVNIAFQVQLQQFADRMQQASDLFDQYKTKFEQVGDGIGKAGLFISKYVDQVAGAVITTLGGVVSYIPEIAKGMAQLSAAAVANPWVALAVVITAAGAALAYYIIQGNEANKVQRLLNDVQEEGGKIAAKEKAELDALVKTAKDDTISRREREAAMRKINAISPEYLGNITLEEIKTKKATSAIKEYVEVLKYKAQQQAIDAKMTELYAKEIELQMKDVVDYAGAGLFRNLFNSDAPIIKSRVELEEYIEAQRLSGREAEKVRKYYEPLFKIREKELSLINKQKEALSELSKKNKEAIPERDDSGIAYYEEQIRMTQKMQKAPGVTAARYQELQKEIEKYKAKIREITGEEEKLVSTRTKLSKIKEVVPINPGSIKAYQAQIDALRKIQLESENITPEKYAEIAEKIRDIQKSINSITGETRFQPEEGSLDWMNQQIAALEKERSSVYLSKEAYDEIGKSIDAYKDKIKELTNTINYTEGSQAYYEEQIKGLKELQSQTEIASLKWNQLQTQIEDIECVVKAKLDETSFAKAQSAIASLEAVEQERAEAEANRIKKQQENAQVFQDSMLSIFDSLTSNLKGSAAVFANVVKGLAPIILKQIAMNESASMGNALQGATQSGLATGPGAAFSTPAFIASMLAVVAGAFAGIKKFANGGVVYGPTLGLMGEYAGASSNPEVIAPLSKLKDLIEPAATNNGVAAVLLSGDFRISGNDLVLAIDRTNKRRKRTG